MSSWFGGGSKKQQEREEPVISSDSYSGGSSSFDSHNMYGSGSSSGGGGGNNASMMAEIEEFGNVLQQSMMLQQILNEVTEKSFKMCCSTPTRDNKLTGKEVACIHSVTSKWLLCNEFLIQRLGQKQQQQQQSQYS